MSGVTAAPMTYLQLPCPVNIIIHLIIYQQGNLGNMMFHAKAHKA